VAEQKIVISIEGRGETTVSNLAEAVTYLKTVTKDADYQFRQEKISAADLEKTLNSVNEASQKLNLTYKQQVDVNAAVYQVQQRASVGFKSLAVDTAVLKDTSQRSLTTLSSFSQIIQDSGQFSMGAAQGVRAIANNITFLTQNVAYSISSGMTFNQVVKGMASAILGPGGILLGVSLLTTGLQLLPSLFKETGDEAKTAGEKIENPFLKALNKLEELRKGRKQLRTDEKMLKLEVDVLQKSIDSEIKLKTQSLGELAKYNKPLADKLRTEFQQWLRDQRLLLEDAQAELYKVQEALGMHGMPLDQWKRQVEENFRNQSRGSSGAGAVRGEQYYARRHFNAGVADIMRGGGAFNGFNTLDELDKHQKEILKIKEEALNVTKEELNLLQTTGVHAIQTMTGLIHSEFRQAWVDAFGEANSLFEKFSQEVLSFFATEIFKFGAFALLSSLFPGSGFVGFLGKSMGLLGGGSGASSVSPSIAPSLGPSMMQPIVAPIYIGDDQIGTLAINAMGRASYRRII
jgi:hypothetical protein